MSWVTEVWAAQRSGRLNGEEAWQILLDAREAPDPAGVVRSVLRGLALVPCVMEQPFQEASEVFSEPIVIEDAAW